MKKRISFIGGDLITVYLINAFLKEKYEIKTYAFDGAIDLIEDSDRNKKNMFSEDIKETIKFSDIIVFAMPFKNTSEQVMSTFSNKQIDIKEIIPYLNKKIIFAGNLSNETLNKLKEQNTTVYNLSENNELKIANALIASEASVQIVKGELQKLIHGTKILILGFGRLGKMLCKTFKSLDADVTCEARKDADLAWIKAYGYKALDLEDLSENINNYEVIINTIPFKILDEERIKKMNPKTFILDLADDVRGIDIKAARKAKIKNVWALSLPEKTAPVFYAESIKNIMKNILRKNINK